ncbi:TYW5 [Branchiostoma lanceolatum]|uniref:TYW5 protein n=1 Tax=Branchiostoma lanceolatum TaxID=7740 RepID=A0A8J9ZV58_BRALA|nr:TYW5 [Branchiostoma lanceolatum]
MTFRFPRSSNRATLTSQSAICYRWATRENQKGPSRSTHSHWLRQSSGNSMQGTPMYRLCTDKEVIYPWYRQAIAKAPAVTNWQRDEYIREKYGDLDVLIEKKIEDRMNPVRLRMPLSEFLDNYHDKQWYVVSLLPDPMRAEMQVPRSLLCGNFKDSILESNLWLSSGGTRSVLHYDADHNLHCLISGRKDFIMIPNKYTDKLDLADNKKAGSGFTHMNVDKVDLVKNPEVSEVPWTWATLQPGDCIFIPSRYFHQVRSYGRSVAATIMWDPFPEFNYSDCATIDIDKYTALSDVRL